MTHLRLTNPLFIVAMLAISVVATLDAGAADPPPGQIASVNGTMVLRQDLDREMNLIAMKLARQGRPMDPEQLNRYRGNVRETLINRILLLATAQSKEIRVSDTMVAKAMDEFKAGFQEPSAYQAALKEMGYTEAQLEAQIRDGLTIKSLLDKELLRKVSVSDQQVRDYYDQNPQMFQQPEQVRASHILIQVPENADEAKKAEALASIQALKQRIDNGETFANLAMDYSDCPSKAKGGDLGFFTREQMVPPFSDAAFALQPGQVSDVVTTRFGYHLIRLTERKSAETMAYNDVKEAIAGRLRQEQEEKKIDAYLQELKKHADIKRFPL